MTRGDVYGLINTERARQAMKWNRDHAWGIGDCSSSDVPPIVKVAVLTEECGEVARAVLDRQDSKRLCQELVQVAAVAVAWLEALDNPEQGCTLLS